MSFIVNQDWLKEKLEKSNDKIAVIDVRAALTDAEIGREQFNKGHIPGAVYLDLNTDLSGEVGEHGGNHPLPDVSVFAEKMGLIGIDQDTTVVVYDANNDMYSARMLWLLNYMGHKKVYILDGGFKQWTEAEYEVTTEIAKPSPTTFSPRIQSNTTADMEEVKTRNSSVVLVDSRAHDRYIGTNEPLYKKAGHIPGAKHFSWQNVLDEDGLWKDVSELEDNFATLPKDTEIIVSCGSGISACPNIVGLKEAGYKNVKLYPGSFSDWISYEDNDVITGEE